MQQKRGFVTQLVTGIEISVFFGNFFIVATAFCVLVRAVAALPSI